MVNKKQTKNSLIYGVIAVVIILGLIFIPDYGSEDETIKIGAAYPLSGDMANYGTEYKRGLEMAAEEINNDGGINGRKVELIFEDDKGRAEDSVTAVKKLINIDDVDYLFTSFSSPSQATAPIAQENKVLYISATVSKIGNTGDYVFRDFWDIENQGEAIGNSMNKEGVNRAGILAMNYGDTEMFLKGVKSGADNVTFVETRFNFGDGDFKTQLTKLKNEDVDAILVYAFPGQEAMKITNQIKELGMDNKQLFAGATTYGLPFMYDQFNETLAKMEAIDGWYSLDESNAKAKEFTEKYESKYSDSLTGDAAYPYDDLYALKKAIENTETSENRTKVAEELKKTELDGVAGKLSFDENGNSQRRAYLQQYSENGWREYDLE